MADEMEFVHQLLQLDCWGDTSVCALGQKLEFRGTWARQHGEVWGCVEAVRCMKGPHSMAPPPYSLSPVQNVLVRKCIFRGIQAADTWVDVGQGGGNMYIRGARRQENREEVSPGIYGNCGEGCGLR